MPTIMQDYYELTKPYIVKYCVVMTMCGVLLATYDVSFFSFFLILLGSACAMGSAGAFNQIYERKLDKLMQRTQSRPLPSGRLKTKNATIFASLLGIFGICILLEFANLLTAMLAFIGIFIYILIYTPLKTKTPLYLLFGPIPMALAPVLGIVAIQDRISLLSVLVFLITYTGKMTHLIARSICNGKQYEAAGFKLVSLVRSAYATRVQAVLWAVLLLLFSILPVFFKLAGNIYLIFTSLLGLWLLFISFQGILNIRNPVWPKKFFFASFRYFPMLTVIIIVDRVFNLSQH